MISLRLLCRLQQQQTPFTMQDGYRSNAYLNISVRDNARITCEALKSMSSTELTKLWKVFSCIHQHNIIISIIIINIIIIITNIIIIIMITIIVINQHQSVHLQAHCL